MQRSCGSSLHSLWTPMYRIPVWRETQTPCEVAWNIACIMNPPHMTLMKRYLKCQIPFLCKVYGVKKHKEWKNELLPPTKNGYYEVAYLKSLFSSLTCASMTLTSTCRGHGGSVGEDSLCMDLKYWWHLDFTTILHKYRPNTCFCPWSAE